MSLYSFEEICKGCEYSWWHRCKDCYRPEDKKFCHCYNHHERDIDHESGKCKYYFNLTSLKEPI